MTSSKGMENTFTFRIEENATFSESIHSLRCDAEDAANPSVNTKKNIFSSILRSNNHKADGSHLKTSSPHRGWMLASRAGGTEFRFFWGKFEKSERKNTSSY